MRALALTNWFPTALLAAILLCAVWQDVRARRIPNLLVVGGTLAALALHMILPPGSSLFGNPSGSLGLASSLSGFGLGLLLLLPFYAFGTLGAGDVKLMAMIGAFVGSGAIIGTILATMIAGGVLALVAAACKGRLRLMMDNLYMMAATRSHHQSPSSADGRSGSAGNLPYALAIAAGTAVELIRISH